jgi:SAM-dependent methyltransferase
MTEKPAPRTIWDMGTLPFHMGPLPRPQVDGFPERMPFRVGYDDELGLYTQVFDDEVMSALHEVYARGSQLGIPMGDHGLGKAYADDFEGVIRAWLGDGLASSDVLEIGCGSGHLLGMLSDAGARAFGVEPDPRCAPAMQERGITVATCELEDFEPDRTFDTVLHYCVWEHTPDPVDFLARQRALLKPGGRIICAVPDCTEALAAGDISIFIHQHWSYFSDLSLRRVAAAAGLRVDDLRPAAVGGVLYAWMSADEQVVGDAADGVETSAGAAGLPEAAGGTIDPERMVALARRASGRFVDYVHGVAKSGRSLGIYCPTRAINYVPDGDETVAGARLFDDAPLLRGKYVPPFRRPVEGRDGIDESGPDEVLIMSRSFGGAIEAAIRALPSASPRIRHIDDVLAGD